MITCKGGGGGGMELVKNRDAGNLAETNFRQSHWNFILSVNELCSFCCLILCFELTLSTRLLQLKYCHFLAKLMKLKCTWNTQPVVLIDCIEYY